MKPEELKSSPLWTQKKIWIDDHVWYVPERSDDTSYDFPGWDSVFGNANPVHVEYCSGNGAWVAAKAASLPEINWVAVEKKFSRVRKIWAKIKNALFGNLFVLCGEGFHATRRFFPPESIDSVYVNFPDPWPKKRHHKYRLINEGFVDDMWRVMKPGAIFTAVTDDVEYSLWIIAIFQQDPRWESVYPEPFYSSEFSGYGNSYFEDLWRSKGLSIRYHQFRKKDSV